MDYYPSKKNRPKKRRYRITKRTAVIFSALVLLILAVVFVPKMIAASKPDGRISVDGKVRKGMYTVVVDAGHGGFDEGNTGVSGTVQEKDINLAIALVLQQKLQNAGYDVVMTRSGPGAIAETKDADLQKREEIIRADGVDLVLSIHQGYSEDASASGTQLLYAENGTESEILSGLLQKALGEGSNAGQPEKAKAGTYQILRASNVPCVVAECGNLSNEQEEALLQTPEHQHKLAEAMLYGVEEYFITRENTEE